MNASQSQDFWMRVSVHLDNPSRSRFFRLLPIAAAVIAADILAAIFCL